MTDLERRLIVVALPIAANIAALVFAYGVDPFRAVVLLLALLFVAGLVAGRLVTGREGAGLTLLGSLLGTAVFVAGSVPMGGNVLSVEFIVWAALMFAAPTLVGYGMARQDVQYRAIYRLYEARAAVHDLMPPGWHLTRNGVEWTRGAYVVAVGPNGDSDQSEEVEGLGADEVAALRDLAPRLASVSPK